MKIQNIDKATELIQLRKFYESKIKALKRSHQLTLHGPRNDGEALGVALKTEVFEDEEYEVLEAEKSMSRVVKNHCAMFKAKMIELHNTRLMDIDKEIEEL